MKVRYGGVNRGVRVYGMLVRYVGPGGGEWEANKWNKIE
jgi:hypothetical protein